MSTGTATREATISACVQALQQISQANGYQNNPIVERTLESYNVNENPCVIYCAEYEEFEEISHLAFGTEMGKIAMVVQGKITGTQANINSLIDDIRQALESEANTVSAYISITRAATYRNYADENDPRLFCDVYFNVLYTYDIPLGVPPY